MLVELEDLFISESVRYHPRYWGDGTWDGDIVTYTCNTTVFGNSYTTQSTAPETECGVFQASADGQVLEMALQATFPFATPDGPTMYIAIPADNRILYFERDRDSFRCFSHFHLSPVELDGESWPTAEHYYQAQRSDDPAYRQAIRETASPGKVKHLSLSPGKKVRGVKRSWFLRNNALPRADWKAVKLEVMRRVDRAKFAQNPELLDILLSTGDAELIEDSPWDEFWGIGPDGNGCNWAGKVLMEIRSELRAR